MRIRVKVKTNARANEVKIAGENFYEVKVTVPPEKGKANEKVIELLSVYFRVPKSKIRIIQGLRNKEKILDINL